MEGSSEVLDFYSYLTVAQKIAVCKEIREEGAKPSKALAKRSDVRHVMPAVPGVLRQVLIQPPHAGFGMREGAVIIAIGHRFHQLDPADVQGIEQIERRIDGQGGISEHGPARLVVRLDGGLVFRQRQLKPDERVHVAVGHMMHHLARGPAARAVRRIQLLRGKAGDRRTEFLRRAGNLADPRLPLLGGGGVGK